MSFLSIAMRCSLLTVSCEFVLSSGSIHAHALMRQFRVRGSDSYLKGSTAMLAVRCAASNIGLRSALCGASRSLLEHGD